MSMFFEPSIESTVNTIVENFTGVLFTNSVRESGISKPTRLKVRSTLFSSAGLPQAHGYPGNSMHDFPTLG